jgi:hypothetical protein
MRCIVIPGERPKSWNNFYAGMHWNTRREEANRVHSLVRAYLDPDLPLMGRVDIEVVVYFANWPMDACNICAKVYIDGLIGWYIEDDALDYVRSVKTIPRIDKDHPRVEIYLWEVNEEDDR